MEELVKNSISVIQEKVIEEFCTPSPPKSVPWYPMQMDFIMDSPEQEEYHHVSFTEDFSI